MVINKMNTKKTISLMLVAIFMTSAVSSIAVADIPKLSNKNEAETTPLAQRNFVSLKNKDGGILVPWKNVTVGEEVEFLSRILYGSTNCLILITSKNVVTKERTLKYQGVHSPSVDGEFKEFSISFYQQGEYFLTCFSGSLGNYGFAYFRIYVGNVESENNGVSSSSPVDSFVSDNLQTGQARQSNIIL